jgi:hypothetical protein
MDWVFSAQSLACSPSVSDGLSLEKEARYRYDAFRYIEELQKCLKLYVRDTCRGLSSTQASPRDEYGLRVPASFLCVSVFSRLSLECELMRLVPVVA